MIIQRIDTIAAKTVNPHSMMRLAVLGFRMRHSMALTASLGSANDRMPNRKLMVLSRIAISSALSVRKTACLPYPTTTLAVVIPQ